MAKIDELKQEAKELGIKFNPNISETKLQERIDAWYEEREKKVAEEEQENDLTVETTQNPQSRQQVNMGKLAREAENKARKTRIVTIIDNDQRENSRTTSVTVNCSNEWFDLGQVILPLNTPVEVMQGHIDTLKEVEIPMHIPNDKTGLNRTVLRKRYTITEEDKTIK